MTPLKRSRYKKIDRFGHQNKSKGNGNSATGFYRDNGNVAFGDPLKVLERINREVRNKEADDAR